MGRRNRHMFASVVRYLPQACLASTCCLLLYVRLVQRFSARKVGEFYPLFPIIALLCIVAIMLNRRLHWPLALVVLVVQHVYFGGIDHFPQMFIHGLLTYDICPSKGDYRSLVATYVLTTHVNERVQHIHTELAHYDISYTLFNGITSIPKEYQHTHMKHTWPYMLLLQQAYNQSKTPWLAILEDDAVLHYDFKHQIECILDLSSDLIWLDARSHINYAFFGYTGCCTAGMLIQHNAVNKILDHVGPNASYHLNFNRFHPQYLFSIDSVLSNMCSDGTLKCRVRPLVSEKGFETLNARPSESRHK